MKKRASRGPLDMMTRIAPAISSSAGKTNCADRAGAVDVKASDASALSISVGQQIRSLRLAAGLTTVDLAKRAGLSNGMMSKIERGTTQPSFTSLAAIAKAINIPVARLFAGYDNRQDLSFVPAGRGVVVRRRGSKAGYSYQLLGHLLSGEIFVEPYLVNIDNAAPMSASFQHTGVEFMFILGGRIRFRYADSTIEAGPGDTLLFDANAIHGIEDIIEGPVSMLLAVMNLRS